MSIAQVLEYYMNNKFVFVSDTYNSACGALNDTDRRIFYDRTTVKFAIDTFSLCRIFSLLHYPSHCDSECNEYFIDAYTVEIFRWMLTHTVTMQHLERNCIWLRRTLKIYPKHWHFIDVYGSWMCSQNHFSPTGSHTNCYPISIYRFIDQNEYFVLQQ